MSEQASPWYKTWKIIPAILFFPITLIYLTWKSKLPMIAKVVIILVIFVGSVKAMGSNNEPQAIAENRSTPSEQPIASPSPEPVKEQTIEEKIQTIAQTRIDKDVKTQLDTNEKYLLVTISDKDITFFDETDMAKRIWSFYIPLAKEIFNQFDISRIKLAITSEFVDTYGKSTTTNSVSIDMTKEDFMLFDWENLKYTEIPKNQNLIEKSNYYIHALIYPKVKTEKLKLVF